MITKSLPWIFAVATALIPLATNPTNMDPGLLIRHVLLAILVVLLSVLFLMTNAKTLPVSESSVYIVLCFAGYTVMSGLSLFGSTNPYEGMLEVCKNVILFFYLCYAIIIFSSSEYSRRVIITTIILVAFVESLLGFAQLFKLVSVVRGFESPNGTLIHKNLFGAWLMLCVPFAAYKIIINKGLRRYLWALILICFMGGIVIADSRSAYLSLIIGSAICGLIVFYHYYSEWSLTVRQLVFVWIPLMGVLLIVFLLRTHLTSMDTGRFGIWIKTLPIIPDYWLTGVGAGNWKIVFPSYGLEGLWPEFVYGMSHYQRPHNDFLWILAELGIFGLTFYVMFFYFAIKTAYNTFKEGDDRNTRMLALFMMMGIIGFVVDSNFSFPKERIEGNMLQMVMISMVISLSIKKSGNFRTIPIKRLVLPNIFALIICIIVIFLTFSMMLADSQVKQALAARKAKNWQGVITTIDKVRTPFYTLDPTAAPLAWYRGVANYSLGNLDSALVDFLKAYGYHPYHVHVLNNIASTYAKLGEYDKAIEYYQKALRVSPDFEEGLLNLAIVYINTGAYEKARDTVLKCSPNRANPRIKEVMQLVTNKFKSNSEIQQ